MTRRAFRQSGTAVFGYMLSLVVVLAAWQYASSRAIVPMLLPSPFNTLNVGADLWASGQLLSDIEATLIRIVLGFAVGCAIGLPVGLFMGSFQPVRQLFEPFLHFLRFLPALAWIPAAMMWFGTGEDSKIALLAYATVFVVALNTMAGVASIPRNQIRAACCFGATRWQIFLLVTIPATLNYMVTGMRLAMGNCFQTVVAAELVASDSGLGFLIFSSRRFMQTEIAYVGIAVLGTIGILTDLLFQLATRSLLWPYVRQQNS
jgi:ABC-type nitrate/sulfonate/bicarbonate transport system permease component